MKSFVDQKALFVGLGFELELILKHIFAQKLLQPKNVAFTRRNITEGNKQAEKFDITFFNNNIEAVKSWNPDVIFVGVKPDDLGTVLTDFTKVDSIKIPHIIFVTASLPFKEVAEILSNSQISNVIPDDHIDIEHPNNFVVYCSTLERDTIIEDIFEPTCQKLIKVTPDEMVPLTTIGCQGNPILNLLLVEYTHKHISDSFSNFATATFTELRDYLSQNTPPAVNSLASELATGYFSICKKLNEQETLYKELLYLTFDGMVHKNAYYSLPPEELDKTIANWATVGGYEEKGIEVVKESYANCSLANYYQNLPEVLFKEMNQRGLTILNKNKELIYGKFKK